MTCGGSKGEPGFVCDAHGEEGTLECLRSAHGAGQIHRCPGCPDCKPCEECGGLGWVPVDDMQIGCTNCNGTGVEP